MKKFLGADSRETSVGLSRESVMRDWDCGCRSEGGNISTGRDFPFPYTTARLLRRNMTDGRGGAIA